MTWWALALGVVWLIRLSRFVALAQQKEYRLDRLKLFFTTDEGLLELLRFIPGLRDFSRTGFKRPKLTARVLAVVATTLILYGLVGLALAWQLPQLTPERGWLLAVASGALAIILVPVFVGVSIIPSAVVAAWQTSQVLARASAVLNQRQPLIIGITGSYGKSSTKQLLAHVLRSRYTVFATPRSFNTRYSVANSIVSGYHGESIAVLEFGAYGPGEIAALASRFVPKIAVVTGITKQHLGLFTSLQHIIRAKSELVAALAGAGSVFYNDILPQVKQIVDQGLKRNREAASISVYPASAQSMVRHLSAAKLDTLGRLSFAWGVQRVHTRLVGMHYFEILKLVIAVAAKLDVNRDQIISALETFAPSGTFISAYQLKSGARVIDDGGTSNPQGFRAALDLVAHLPGKKPEQIILVTPGIVDLGGESEAIHAQLAKLATEVVSHVWYVGQSGKDQFALQFKTEFTADQELIEDQLNRLNHDTMILIEGKMPGWFSQALGALKE